MHKHSMKQSCNIKDGGIIGRKGGHLIGHVTNDCPLHSGGGGEMPCKAHTETRVVCPQGFTSVPSAEGADLRTQCHYSKGGVDSAPLLGTVAW